MAIADDLSVDVGGNIRWTGTTNTQYTVLELHRFLQDLADDAQASGNDLVDITTSAPSERSTAAYTVRRPIRHTRGHWPQANMIIQKRIM